jgi:hypothetical protein
MMVVFILEFKKACMDLNKLQYYHTNALVHFSNHMDTPHALIQLVIGKIIQDKQYFAYLSMTLVSNTTQRMMLIIYSTVSTTTTKS